MPNPTPSQTPLAAAEGDHPPVRTTRAGALLDTDDPAVWNRYVTVFMEAGLAYADAALWAYAPEFSGIGFPDVLAAEIGQYLDRGFTAVEGYYWAFHGFGPPHAVHWANHGWHPAQADRLYDYLHTVGPHDPNGPGRIADAWLDTGIPPHRVLLYASAACTPTEGIAFEARRAAGENIDPGLRVLAALNRSRGAW